MDNNQNMNQAGMSQQVMPQQVMPQQVMPQQAVMQSGPVYQQPKVPYPNIPDYDPNYNYTPVTAWSYFWYKILFAIPIVGLVFLIVFSVGGTRNINLRNYARSYFCALLILAIVAVVVFIVLAIIAIVSGVGIAAMFEELMMII